MWFFISLLILAAVYLLSLRGRTGHPGMEELRRWADKLETRVADNLWPLPSYLEMLFMK